MNNKNILQSLQSYNLTILLSYNLTILQFHKLVTYNYLSTYLLTHNVDTRDPIRSKNSLKITLRQCALVTVDIEYKKIF